MPELPLQQSEETEALVAMLDLCTHRFGPHHPDTVSVVNQLAMALWRGGDGNRAIGLLDQTLADLTSSLGDEHPSRVSVLSTLGEIMLEQHHPEQAGIVFREVLDCCVRRAGETHASSLAAKGDLAIALFELGQEQEAWSLELDAFESARTHLGRAHPVTSVLAWNRTMMYERSRDPDSAREMMIKELVWLLAEDPSGLGPDQNAIRAMLAERFNWDAARAC